MGIKKILLVVIGCITLTLGAVGAVIPILPTVPFLLIAAACFAKSSDKLNNWFVATNLYKNNLESYVKGQGMTKATKLRIIITFTILMGIGIVMMMNVPIGQITLAVVWVAHLVYFLAIVKTKQ